MEILADIKKVEKVYNISKMGAYISEITRKIKLMGMEHFIIRINKYTSAIVKIYKNMAKVY